MAQKPMTKTELVAALVEKTGLGKSDASRMLEALLRSSPSGSPLAALSLFRASGSSPAATDQSA